jgi:hypothetical protein
MSALPPKADIQCGIQNVCFGPKADISLTSAGALADAPAELSCQSSEQPRRSYFGESHDNARMKKSQATLTARSTVGRANLQLSS